MATVEGEVEQRNANGIYVDGDWRNVSRFHPPAEPLPQVGTRVRVELDERGFIRSIQILDAVGLPVGGADRRSTRLSVLHSAAAFAAPRPEIRSADVLTLAERWLNWVEQDA